MTRKACVAGSCALRASPLAKHETQRSKSLHAGSAHRMRTCEAVSAHPGD